MPRLKAIMYHYVRPGSSELPHLRYLDLDQFRKQLDWFAAQWNFASRTEIEKLIAGENTLKKESVVLTFDDGLHDHFEHVLPELKSRGLWGIFYIPTGPYKNKKLLDVHRIHCLLGKYGGSTMIEASKKYLEPRMMSHEHIKEFRELTYSSQKNTADTAAFKRIMNYFVADEWKTQILDSLMKDFFDEPELTSDFYIAPEQIKKMHDEGMWIGSHSITHPVFSKQSREVQKTEISESFAALDSFTGGIPMRTFCYPYGGFYTFTKETERFLVEEGCKFSFNVEPRDIETADWVRRPQALPRYDCNLFPHGKASGAE